MRNESPVSARHGHWTPMRVRETYACAHRRYADHQARRPVVPHARLRRAPQLLRYLRRVDPDLHKQPGVRTKAHTDTRPGMGALCRHVCCDKLGMTATTPTSPLARGLMDTCTSPLTSSPVNDHQAQGFPSLLRRGNWRPSLSFEM